MLQDIPDFCAVVSAIPSAAYTATQTGSSFQNKGYVGDLLFIADVGVGTGTTPTLALKVQDSADNSTFADLTGGAIASATTSAAVSTLVVPTANVRQYVRVVGTIAGTTPSYPLSVTVVATKKYD